MVDKKKLELNPYHRFSKAEWAEYRDGEPMTLSAADIERLRALTDPISLAEAEEIYLPLSRLISFYVEAAQAVHRVSTRFLGSSPGCRMLRPSTIRMSGRSMVTNSPGSTS